MIKRDGIIDFVFFTASNEFCFFSIAFFDIVDTRRRMKEKRWKERAFLKHLILENGYWRFM